jgi:protein tyrosine phosphatase
VRGVAYSSLGRLRRFETLDEFIAALAGVAAGQRVLLGVLHGREFGCGRTGVFVAVEDALEEGDPGVVHGGAEEEDEDFDANKLFSSVSQSTVGMVMSLQMPGLARSALPLHSP